MATKRSQGTIQNIVDAISELLRQPMSDESNEVPSKKAVRRSERVAAGPRRSKAKAKPKAKAKAKAKAKTSATKKRPAARGKKAKPAARKKKR